MWQGAEQNEREKGSRVAPVYNFDWTKIKNTKIAKNASKKGVRKVLRNLQLQEQQKLVIDYKIQCYIDIFISVQHSVTVAPVYHFVSEQLWT